MGFGDCHHERLTHRHAGPAVSCGVHRAALELLAGSSLSGATMQNAAGRSVKREKIDRAYSSCTLALKSFCHLGGCRFFQLQVLARGAGASSLLQLHASLLINALQERASASWSHAVPATPLQGGVFRPWGCPFWGGPFKGILLYFGVEKGVPLFGKCPHRSSTFMF